MYAMSTMDLRLEYFTKYPRVPLHPIQYSLESPLSPPPPGNSNLTEMILREDYL
jgi:hypothetical protein